jgi:hypothetical protein
MPRLENSLFAIQAILENGCLAVNLAYAHLYNDEYGGHSGSGGRVEFYHPDIDLERRPPELFREKMKSIRRYGMRGGQAYLSLCAVGFHS